MASPSRKYLSKLANQRVLVLGGSSGIGFCVAEAALEYGAEVIISSSNQDNVDKALDRLRATYPSGHVTGYACDLADPSNVQGNITNLLRSATKGGKLNHVAFTAGDFVMDTAVPRVTIEIIHAVFAVRFVGAVMLAQQLPDYMDLSPSNSLTLTGGTNTDKPMPGWSVLAGVGGSVEGLVRGLAVDLKPLRVNLVSPGAVHTELFDKFKMGEAQLESMRAVTTTGEVGRPEDVAEAYIYAMKDRFVSGAVINTNGGRLLA
jgi:NAD(P)-dependent dehydrogenase (short-subunit alcohol dehydrogenase family)